MTWTSPAAWPGREALVGAGVLSESECAVLVDGLERVRAEFAAGTFAPAPGDEDIHTAVERRLGELVGRWQASCTPGAAATTRWRPTCCCGCWTRARSRWAALLDLAGRAGRTGGVHARGDHARLHAFSTGPAADRARTGG